MTHFVGQQESQAKIELEANGKNDAKRALFWVQWEQRYP